MKAMKLKYLFAAISNWVKSNYSKLTNTKFFIRFNNLKKRTRRFLVGTAIGVIITSIIAAIFSSIIFPGNEKKIVKNTEKTISISKNIKEDTEQIKALTNELLKSIDNDKHISSEALKTWIPQVLKPTEKASKEAIDELFKNDIIAPELKENLEVTVSEIHKFIEVQNIQIDSLSNDYSSLNIVNFLKELNANILSANSEKIIDDYNELSNRNKQNEILILKKSIDACLLLNSYQEAKQLLEKLIEVQPSIFNYYRYAECLGNLMEINEAKKYYNIAIQKIELEDNIDKNYYKLLSGFYNNLGKLCQLSNSSEALFYYNKSYELLDSLNEDNSSEIQYSRILSLGNIAETYVRLKKIKEAIVYYDKALVLAKNWKSFQYPEGYIPMLYYSYLHRKAEAYSQIGQHEMAVDTLKYICTIYESIHDYSDILNEDYSDILFELGKLLIEMKFYDEGIKYGIESIEILKEAPKKTARYELDLGGKHYMISAYMLTFKKNKEEAKKYYGISLNMLEKYFYIEDTYYRSFFTSVLIVGVLHFDYPPSQLERASELLETLPKNKTTKALRKQIKQLKRKMKT